MRSNALGGAAIKPALSLFWFSCAAPPSLTPAPQLFF